MRCDCEVAKQISHNQRLRKWVQAQRLSIKNTVMDKERREEVNSIGLDWIRRKFFVCNRQPTDNENWDVHFRELLAYLQAHGDSNVPQGDPHNPILARWVSEQRNDYDLKRRGEQTSLTPLREAKLDAIGFTWFVGGSTKEDAYAEGVSSSAVWPEESQSENKVRSEQAGVATSPDNITSG